MWIFRKKGFTGHVRAGKYGVARKRVEAEGNALGR